MERNVCLTVRTTKELSKKLDLHKGYLCQKSTVAHILLSRIMEDLSSDDVDKIIRMERGLRLKIVKRV